MSFEYASGNIRDLLSSGAWWALGRVYGGEGDWPNAMAWLQGYYNRLGQYDVRTFVALLRRYQAGLDAAASLMRRPVNPVPDEDIPGYPGLSSAYQYQVVQWFVDPHTGRRFSRLFLINSDQNLTRDQVLANNRAAVQDYLDDPEYVTLRHGEADWQLAAQPPRIVGIVKRI